MKQVIFNIVVTVAVLAVGVGTAIPLFGPGDSAPAGEELQLRQQVELLSHKVVVLGARQSEAEALRREVETLRKAVSQLQQALDAALHKNRETVHGQRNQDDRAGAYSTRRVAHPHYNVQQGVDNAS